MSLTGNQLLQGFSIFINDWWQSTLTSAGNAGGTTIVDTALSRAGDDVYRDYFVRINDTDETTANYRVRRASAFTNSTGTVTVAPAFGEQIDSGSTYELHKYEPADKFRALDAAILAISDKLPQVVYDETITLDGVSYEYSIPSNIRRGPLVVSVEEPLSPDYTWNFLTSPRGDSLTGWTAASVTAALYARTDEDLLIPKYDQYATKLSVGATTNGTYTQPVADMAHNVTAARAAGRQMAFGMWVYCKIASRVTLELADDTSTTSSTAHAGGGWQFLSLVKTIDPDNATTLTAGIDVSSAASPVTAYWNRGWLMFGEQVPSCYPRSLLFRVRRDDTTGRIYLPRGLRGRRQLRVIGIKPLTTLGETASTQATTTVEIDVNSAQLLYAKAAQILFGRELLEADRFQDVALRVRVAEAATEELIAQWTYDLGVEPRVVGPYG